VPAHLNIPKETIEDLYINKNLSTWKIAEVLNCARSTIYTKILLFKIPIINRAEAHIIYPRKNFSDNLIEKAYLIGFRIGDLRVRKFYKNSETIKLDCASTKIEQINLIKQLFLTYGRIWISKPNKKGATQIECSLNTSFEFLLTKTPPKWIFKNRSFFYAFLAGFTDAEGTIFISNKQAHYALGNYDINLLEQIKSYLEEYGMRVPKITCSHRQGLLASHGYRYNHDYWTLHISRKVEMLKLLSLIGPHLKHANRIRQMNIGIINIKERNRLYGQK